MRRLVLTPEPAACVEVEQAHRALGPLLQLGRQSGEHLQARVRENASEPELGGGPDEQRLRLLTGQTRELRAVPAGEPVAPGRAAHRLHRDARIRERLDVALDRPFGDLEPVGELGRGQLPPRLQEEQERDQSTGAHLPRIHDKRCRN
jgi:hypothetical protein